MFLLVKIRCGCDSVLEIGPRTSRTLYCISDTNCNLKDKSLCIFNFHSFFLFCVFFFPFLCTHTLFAARTQLHTLCQGKFILVDRFEIYEKSDQRRRYKGKVFLFEKCIIYTELFSKNRLQYRGHFRHVSLGFTFEDQRNYFRLYNERKGNQETEFSTDSQTIQLWIQMLNRTMTAVVQQEQKKIKESSRSSSVRSDLSPLHLLLQNSTPILQNIVMSPTTPLSECMMDMHSNSTDASYRNTGDYSNADTMSIKSGRK